MKVCPSFPSPSPDLSHLWSEYLSLLRRRRAALFTVFGKIPMLLLARSRFLFVTGDALIFAVAVSERASERVRYGIFQNFKSKPLSCHSPLRSTLIYTALLLNACKKKRRGSCRVSHLGTDFAVVSLSLARAPQFMHQNGAILRNCSDWRLLFLGGKLVLREGLRQFEIKACRCRWLAFSLERMRG